MKVYTTGRESTLLEDVRSGLKTIDVRLAKPRFKKFKVGDRIRPREDIWQGDRTVASKPTDIELEITKIERFPSFSDMLSKVDLKKAFPRVRSKKEALALCRKFYSEEDEKKLGVIAFHFQFI